LYRNLIS